jgi:hypothetical protein
MPVLRSPPGMRRVLATTGLVFVACGACAAALGGMFAAPGLARLLAPQRINANTGQDALNVGASLGSRQAWAGLVQKTNGQNRLYAAYARSGTFRPAFVADRGNAVVTGGLAGNQRGAAVIVWTEKVGNQQVLFGRRLADGRAGAVVQISVAGEDAQFGNAMFPFDRTHGVAMNDAGAAVLCYFDAAGVKSYAASLAPRTNQWTRHEMACSDPHIDAGGDVLADVGKDANNKFSAAMLVGGQVRNEIIDANVTPMDEFAIGLGAGGTAMALGRDNNFHAIAYRKASLTANSGWENVGPLETDLIQANANPEDPFAALDARGNGIVVFRDNSANNPQGYYRLVSAGRPLGGAVLDHSAARLRPAVDAAGNPRVAYSANDAKSGFINRFRRGNPGTALALAPGLGPYSVPSLTSIAVDTAGDFLVLLREETNPLHVRAVFGDFAAPTLRPSASPRSPLVGQRVRLRSRASDAFADLSKRNIRWTLPRGVQLSRTTTGASIRVKFSRRGRFHIHVVATDPAGNRTRRAFSIRVRARR